MSRAPSASAGPGTSLDVVAIRRDFPILNQRVRGKPLVYLDNAATTQKPQAVVDRLTRYYAEENANIHRAVHWLSERATEAYEEARASVARFLNASDPREIVFVRGTTEAINLVAQTYGRAHLSPGDEIVISEMEHHSNIVPWQMLCTERGARLRVVPITDSGEMDLDAYSAMLNERTRLVSIVHVSNALGTINPVKDIVRIARDRGIPVLVDGAQAVAHLPVDVQDLGCAFYTFSGHKLFGPTGIGVLYGLSSLLDAMPPYQGGGEMISSVTFERTLYKAVPFRFEAGTPHIAGALGLAVAIAYLAGMDREAVAVHEREVLAYATGALSSVDGLEIVGTARQKTGILSFTLDGVHPHDVGTMLDHHSVAIRAGHHCCQPLMDRMGVPATARASFALYNSRADVDALVSALSTVRARFA
jgi:cysteine desulfurase/selenocysteine lyase